MISLILLIFIAVVVESFPVSSSGHIALAQKIFDFSMLQYDTIRAFEYTLHGITALVIALFFFKRWFFLLTHIKRFLPFIFTLFVSGFITELITVLFFGFFEYAGTGFFDMRIGFLITTGALASLVWCKPTQVGIWSWKNALILGTAQGLALLPGISRLGITFVSARWLGFSGRRALELSCLIEWPICIGAMLLGIKKMHTSGAYDVLNFQVLLSMLSAGLLAIGGLHVVWQCALKNKIWYFSVYTAIVALLLTIL